MFGHLLLREALLYPDIPDIVSKNAHKKIFFCPKPFTGKASAK